MENGVRHYACKRDEGRSKIRKKSKVGESRGFFLFFFFFLLVPSINGRTYTGDNRQ